MCFNPQRTEKPKAHIFSVRFGLKHTRGRGVNRKHHTSLQGDVCTKKNRVRAKPPPYVFTTKIIQDFVPLRVTPHCD